MMIIQASNLKILTNLEASNTFSESLVSFKKVDTIALGIDVAVTDFEQKLTRYKELVRVASKMQETDQLAMLDENRDNLIIGIEKIVNSYTKFPDIEKAEAANSLNIILGMYNKQIERLSYIAETEAIEKVLADFKHEPYASQVLALHLNEWTTKLETANTKFNETFIARDEKSATHEKGATRTARNETQTAFTNLCELVNSYIRISGEEGYKTLVDEINQIVTRAKNDHNHAQPH